MGNWLSAEQGLSPADTVQIPSGQRDDNRRGGEEAEGKGRNRAAVEGYSSSSSSSSWRSSYLIVVDHHVLQQRHVFSIIRSHSDHRIPARVSSHSRQLGLILLTGLQTKVTDKLRADWRQYH